VKSECGLIVTSLVLCALIAMVGSAAVVEYVRVDSGVVGKNVFAFVRRLNISCKSAPSYAFRFSMNSVSVTEGGRFPKYFRLPNSFMLLFQPDICFLSPRGVTPSSLDSFVTSVP
jgi:hypothetical protein